jgi:membrane-bound ClpP family serine protease
MAADGRGDAPDGRRSRLAHTLRFVGAAARRFSVLLGSIAGVCLVVGLLGGLLFRAGVDRGVSVAFYCVGCFMLIAGFFIGNRGPARLKGESTMLFGERFVRWASPREREETLNDSAIFVSIGFALILIGAAVDDRHRLF